MNNPIQTISAVATITPLKIMVASTVYHFEDHLLQICGVLRNYGYHVLNSHAGTIHIPPGNSNLQACLKAVEECDLFLGIIRPFYGSGKIGERSITHEEILHAVKLNKPRWFLAHTHVTFTRQFMRQYLFTKKGQRRKKQPVFKKTPVFDDLRVLEMYDDAIQAHVPIEKRASHWAQEYFHLSDAFVFIETQFRDVSKVRDALHIGGHHDKK
ncbi:MAG: DUF4062 domain-containing protein [Planctomycetia bacterium]|nr:DUF4062 domain-containing protein [Planctomycetia bacterium]